MRRRGVLRAAACAIAVAGALVMWQEPGGAGPTLRAAWWSATSPAPAPDAPDDGLHVAGGPQGPSAIAAIAVELPEGAFVQLLDLELAGMAPRVEGLQACVIPAADAGFEPVQNGAWADRPAYDCAAGAITPTVDGTTVRFDVAPLQQGTVLAVALVPGATDRASFAKPDPPAVLIAAATETAPPSSPPAASPPAPARRPANLPAQAVALPAAGVVPAVAPQPAATAPVAVERSVGAAAVVSTEPGEDRPLRTRVGGALGFGLLLAALLFYSQGRGLLGARVGGNEGRST